MRIVLAGILGLLTSFGFAQTHEPMPPQPQRGDVPPKAGHSQPARDGGVRETLESIVIPPIPGAPFFANLATESVKYSADGASMTFVNQRHIGRNTQGQIYEERWALVPKGSNVKSIMVWIQLADPKARTLYNCTPLKHICDLLVYDAGDDLSAATKPLPKPKSVQTESGSQSVEDLGTQSILGIETRGIRETEVTNAGVMGNDVPLTSLSEYWHSDKFAINLVSTRSSPFFGKETFTIIEFTPGEPDQHYFQLPVGYQINDQRKTPPVSQ